MYPGGVKCIRERPSIGKTPGVPYSRELLQNFHGPGTRVAITLGGPGTRAALMRDQGGSKHTPLVYATLEPVRGSLK